MKIAFHGAARTVTGSKHILTLSSGTRILLDCGLFQGLGKDTDKLNRHFGFDPTSIDVMILSHAHIDHAGLIPKLVKEGFKGKIFCTPGTGELASVLLEDSAQIQEDDIRYVNKRRAMRGQELIEPLYTKEDAAKATESFVSMNYDEWFDVTPGVKAMFSDAGHIIGSACVNLEIKDNGQTKRLTFSGDLGRYRDAILRSPSVFPQADYVIMESTYGNSLHELHTSTPDMLLAWIEKTCLKRGGKLIIPAFSVGRTQEILYILNQLEVENRLPPIPYYVDSPLSIQATDIVKKYPSYFNKTIQRVMQTDKDPFAFQGLKYVTTVERSKQLNFENGPMVIISASGMADAGRVKHHISNNIENSRNTILFSGYCEPSSLGGRLLAGQKEVGIYGVAHEVHAEIGAIHSMSAHGDYEDMTQWLACQDPKKVQQLFLVHGEYEVQQDFKERLEKKGFDFVKIPEMHSEIGLG
jgi:metallo-beta-lactamase family protein